MKKFLSLVLALVMTMSLVTISAGAKDFTDNDKVTYDDAVQVVSMLGIVNGYEDGTFKPTNTLTRGAAAKIIANFKLTPDVADALKGSETTFKDVPSTNVFSGYIAYCASEGIIAGYGDGTFKPAGTLTANAFMKMLIGALGYDTTTYVGDNFATKVALKVKELGLAEGNTFVGTKALTREEACLYVFNALQKNGVYYEGGSSVTINGMNIVTGATEKTYTDTYGERVFGLKDTAGTDVFGRATTTWTYGNEKVVVSAGTAVKTYTGSVDAKTLYKDLGLKATAKANYVVNGAEGVEKNIAKDDTKTVFGGEGYVVEVYKTTTGYDVIAVEYYFGKVTKVTPAKGETERTITVDGKKFPTDSFAANDYVLFTKVGNEIQSVELAKTFEGKVQYKQGTSYIIGGTAYGVASTFEAYSEGKKVEMKAKFEGTFYLGIDGLLERADGEAVATSDDYAYIYTVNKVDGTVGDDGLTGSATYKAFFVKADGTKGSAIVKSANTVAKDTVVAYTINANGEMTVVESGNTACSAAFKAEYGKSYAKVGNYYMSNTTKFVFVAIDNNKLVVSTVTGYQNVANNTAKTENLYVVADSANKALTVFVNGVAPENVNTVENVAFLLNEAAMEGYDDEDNAIWTYSVMIDGKADTLVMDGALDKSIKAGDLFAYTENNGVVDASEATKKTATEGVVTAIIDNYVVINGSVVYLADDCVVYALDKGTTTASFAEDTVAVNDIISYYTNGKTGADLRITTIVITGEYEAPEA